MSESAEYTALLEEREETYEALQAAKKILQNGGITSPQAGIVSEMNAAAGQSAAAGTALASLYTGSELEMVVQIDELDISSVEVGQEASIAMDALEDKAYTGEVTQISQIGSTNSGVTTYSVTLRLTADEELKIGMNGTATVSYTHLDVYKRQGLAMIWQDRSFKLRSVSLWCPASELSTTSRKASLRLSTRTFFPV